VRWLPISRWSLRKDRIPKSWMPERQKSDIHSF